MKKNRKEFGFDPKKNWKSIKDEAWKKSNPIYKKFVKNNGQTIAIYDSLPDRKRVQTCLQKVIPQQVQMLRMLRRTMERAGKGKSVGKEKRSF